MGLGAAACLAFGIATEGLGLFLCGLAGGALGGYGGSALGGSIGRGGGSTDRSPCPSCHGLMREWESRAPLRATGHGGFTTRPDGRLSLEDLARLHRFLDEPKP
jgi:hypothetical protein